MIQHCCSCGVGCSCGIGPAVAQIQSLAWELTYAMGTGTEKKEKKRIFLSNGPRDYHTKWSKLEKDKLFEKFYMDSKKWYKWPYLQNRNRFTAIENTIMIIKGENAGKGIN